MRIVIATDQWYPDLMGGVARVATETARRLASSGHEVAVLAPRSGDDGQDEVTREGSLSVFRVLSRTSFPQTFSDPMETRRWMSRLLDRQFDVAVAHTCTTAYGLMRAEPRLPLAFVFHADPARELRYLTSVLPFGVKSVAARGLVIPVAHLLSVSLRSASSLVVLSEFSRGLLHDRSPEDGRRAILINGGVDTRVFTPEGRNSARVRLGLEPNERIVFTVRRLVPRMGLENLVEATALLRDAGRLRVVVAGSGPLQKVLETRRSQLGLAERLTLLGRVPDSELPLWYRAADLFVLPTAAYEGFGLVTAEALSSGTPVVGTPIGATPELLGSIDRRLVMRGTDPRALADGILRGLELETEELRRACRAYVLEHHAWDALMPRWERVLEETAKLRPNRRRYAKERARQTAIEGVVSTIRWTGAPALARQIGPREKAGVIVYHDPSPKTLESHLEVLSKRHSFISLDALVEALRTRDWTEIPPKSIAITLDDGFRRNAELVEIFKSFGVVPTIFLCSRIVGTEHPFWWTAPGIDAEGLKRVPNAERLAALERSSSTILHDRQALSTQEVEMLTGSVTFGAHSATHPILPMCNDDDAREEIFASKHEVELLTGCPCLHFAFPNGDYGLRELELVREAGFLSARTIETGWIHPDTDPYRLPVLPMPDTASRNRAAAQIALVSFAPRVLPSYRRQKSEFDLPSSRDLHA